VLARPEVVISILITMLGFSGTFALYTYVAPLLEDMAGASGSFVTLALALIGIGFTIGNWLGGKLADWSPEGATAIFLIALVVIMLAMPFLLTNQISAAITLLVWGIAAFAIVPPVQTRVMQAASDAPGLASSVNIGAFNLGNAIGAAIGGAVADPRGGDVRDRQHELQQHRLIPERGVIQPAQDRDIGAEFRSGHL
jgi:DHA1 family inner membrane transport protein